MKSSEKLKAILLISGAVAALSTVPATAAAQDRAPDNNNSSVQNSGEGDIIVTARRRAERIQDVPMAISAASGEALEQLNIGKPDELAGVAPGLVMMPGVYGNSNINPTIRSQRQASNNATYDQSVGIYFAEVPLARTQGLNSSFFDLDSVQVLKGPQGTLFGRNTTGGALIITPKAPTDIVEGYMQGTIGNYGLVDLEGALNLPISETLQLRVAGKATKRDGYIYSVTSDRHVDDENSRSWRISLKFEPTETFTNSLVVTGFRESASGTTFKITDVNPDSGIANLHGWYQQLEQLQSLPFHTTTATADGTKTKIKTFGISNITTLDLGGVTLKNIFGYRYVDGLIDWNLQGDIDNAFSLVVRDKGRQISNELNLSGKARDDNLDYFAGLFYFREKSIASQQSGNGFGLSSAQIAALPPEGYVLGQPGGRATSLVLNDPIINTSYSAYAQATYRLPAVPGLSLTAGLRYTRDKREISWRSSFLYTSSANPGPSCRLVDANNVVLDPCVRDAEASWGRMTWTGSIDYKISNDALIYATHRRGYRSGGYTFTAFNAAESVPYDPETVNDYEAGFKTMWRLGDDTRLRLNVAAYYQDYKDIQRQITVPPPGGVGSTAVFFKNAASATVKGVEVEGNLDIGSRLHLGGSFSLSDAYYKSFVVPDLGDFTKAPFAGAPKYTATWLARWVIQDDKKGTLSLSANGYYQSKTVSIDGTVLNQADLTINRNGTVVTVPKQTVYPWDVVPGRHLVNAAVDWGNIMGSDLSVQFFVKNLFDKEYYGYIQGGTGFQQLGKVQASLGAPRTYGLKATYIF